MGEALCVLEQALKGDNAGAARLASIVYEDLRQLATREFRRERVGHTLQPTALVHEALARLIGGEPVAWESRTHFLAVAARAMRRVLIDHARERDAGKRGGGVAQRVSLADADAVSGSPVVDLLALEEALERLGRLHARQSRVVELRFFGELRDDEIAATLGVSERTVRGDWLHARAWLRRALAGDDKA